jgi:hypothetical protein
MKPATSTRLAFGLLALTMLLATAGVAVAAERTASVSAVSGSVTLALQGTPQVRDCAKDATVKVTRATWAGPATGGPAGMAGRWEVRVTSVLKGTLGYESGSGKVLDAGGRPMATFKYDGVHANGTTEGMLVARLKRADGQGQRGGQKVIANFVRTGSSFSWGQGGGTNPAVLLSGPCLPG